MRSHLPLGLALLATVVVVGCSDTQSAAPLTGTTTAPTPKALADAGPWGTIRGQIVYAGEPLPETVELKVDKDQDHCLSKGKLFSQRWVVNPQTKGLRWVAVFLKPAKGQTLAIHDSLKEPNPKEVILDQPVCAYEPHVFIVRKGQTLVAKNPAPVAHNVLLSGLVNSFNEQVPPSKEFKFTQLQPDYTPVRVGCGAHPWMEGWTWVLDHPYAAVTDADGKFEIRLAPSGPQNLVIWHETGYLGGRLGRDGRPIEVKAGEVLDLGKIEFKQP